MTEMEENDFLDDIFKLNSQYEITKSDYQVSVRTSDFRGDHASDIDVALDIEPDMTIKQLVEKVFMTDEIRLFDKQADTIRIKFTVK